MKKFLVVLLFIPVLAFSQKNNAYAKLTNAAGAPIKGTSVAMRYERMIEALSLQSNSSSNDTRISFMMPVSGASGELRSYINSKQTLQKGEVFVTGRDAQRVLLIYKIDMEKIYVESCNDVQDGNGQMMTQVVLRAARIGWTYFSVGKNGANTVSSKSGWDSEKSMAWTGF